LKSEKGKQTEEPHQQISHYSLEHMSTINKTGVPSKPRTSVTGSGTVAEQLMSSTWQFAAWSEKQCPDLSEHGRDLVAYWLVQTYNSTARSQLSNSTYRYQQK
jgi:hypothetical protein